MSGPLTAGIYPGTAPDSNHQSNAQAFVTFYCLANFFNFGPNVTTFIIPGEIFPTRYRSTAHGITAACGKLGFVPLVGSSDGRRAPWERGFPWSPHGVAQSQPSARKSSTGSDNSQLGCLASIKGWAGSTTHPPNCVFPTDTTSPFRVTLVRADSPEERGRHLNGSWKDGGRGSGSHLTRAFAGSRNRCGPPIYLLCAYRTPLQAPILGDGDRACRIDSPSNLPHTD